MENLNIEYTNQTGGASPSPTVDASVLANKLCETIFNRPHPVGERLGAPENKQVLWYCIWLLHSVGVGALDNPQTNKTHLNRDMRSFNQTKRDYTKSEIPFFTLTAFATRKCGFSLWFTNQLFLRYQCPPHPSLPMANPPSPPEKVLAGMPLQTNKYKEL